jgi:four helix bundle protein
MTEITNKTYNLEIRTLEFAKMTIRLCNKLPKTTVTIELIKQLTRSATSVGANYREANEALGKKDFSHRMRITRKETKETTYWLELILESNPGFANDIQPLLQESKELRNIFTSIINRTQS